MNLVDLFKSGKVIFDVYGKKIIPQKMEIMNILNKKPNGLIDDNYEIIFTDYSGKKYFSEIQTSVSLFLNTTPLHFLLQGQVVAFVVAALDALAALAVVTVVVVTVAVVTVAVAVALHCVLTVVIAVNFAFIYTQFLFLYTNKLHIYKNKKL